MPELEIEQIPCLSDNYAVLLYDRGANRTACIDAPDAEVILQRLHAKGWRLDDLLITHHHGDHTGGVLRLKNEMGCTVIGPKAEADRIPGIDRGVSEGDTIRFGSFEIHVIATPGHTLGHVAYWIPQAGVVFVGDTLFSMGSGRVFEGNAEMMWTSLKKLAQLPPETRIYCGHEYTAANARFALSLEPDNAALRARAEDVERLRAAGKPTLPTDLKQELETNPFLRVGSQTIRRTMGLPTAPDWRVFEAVRERKNKA